MEEPVTRWSILVADDDPTVRTVMERWFVRRGFTVTLACDGVEALQRCRSGTIDLVTMDLEMPRMNGIEATHAIKREFPEIPIVVVTGFMHGVETLRGDGVDAVMLKPVRMMELEGVVRGALERVRRVSDARSEPGEICPALP